MIIYAGNITIENEINNTIKKESGKLSQLLKIKSINIVNNESHNYLKNNIGGIQSNIIMIKILILKRRISI